ncbi:hypothetical protein [Kineosporia babensis]|uniref:Uncharacterized protein n=1 Tax=Kineosporia babensis TaxID=499548 RepID=A0A9X1NN52_9ACTN|nr:hypothetical protein [Kineosporia babensis]MCD5316784.1 hypothetical protein [Kineosporia babensis]
MSASSPTGEPAQPGQPEEPAESGRVDHLPAGGFCACCGAVYPCATARRQARARPLPRQFLAPMSRLTRLRAESAMPAH